MPVVACAVLLSVFAHGITSAPLTRRCKAASALTAAPQAGPAVNELPVRGMTAGIADSHRRGRHDGPA
ncbi:hypothetical protein [Streptomyces sp. NBC_01618]|uniref:hypothetical protein n=1 Tax=Streptomyces sp. NBC_01618 TaxID=2975900 RepID=UPI0038680DD1|nr:hypothetical protein OH735_15305 [Streptomyces sp. NBC_01618]